MICNASTCSEMDETILRVSKMLKKKKKNSKGLGLNQNADNALWNCALDQQYSQDLVKYKISYLQLLQSIQSVQSVKGKGSKHSIETDATFTESFSTKCQPNMQLLTVGNIQ